MPDNQIQKEIDLFYINSFTDEGMKKQNFIRITNNDKQKKEEVSLFDEKIKIANDIIERPWLYLDYLCPRGSYEGILKYSEYPDYKKFEMDSKKLLKGISYCKYNFFNFVNLQLKNIIIIDNEIEHSSVFILYTISQNHSYYIKNDNDIIKVFIAKNQDSVINYIYNKVEYKDIIENTKKWSMKKCEYFFKNHKPKNDLELITKTMTKTPLYINKLIDYYDDFDSIYLLRNEQNVSISNIIKDKSCYILYKINTIVEPSSIILPFMNDINDICNEIINIS